MVASVFSILNVVGVSLTPLEICNFLAGLAVPIPNCSALASQKNLAVEPVSS